MSGQPNCGKSTMFNAITGGSARVGNYPGITVDRLEGLYRQNGYEIHLVDLPGTYSLTSNSMEEVVARNVIVDEHPDVVINMIDATALERSLYLAVQFMEIGAPLVLGLNMMDEVRRSGVTIDIKKLSELLGVPAVACTARLGQGKDELMAEVVRLAKATKGHWKPIRLSYGPDLDPFLDRMTRRIEEERFMTDRHAPRWVAIKYLEGDELVMQAGKNAGPLSEELEAICREAERVTRHNSNTTPDAITPTGATASSTPAQAGRGQRRRRTAAQFLGQHRPRGHPQGPRPASHVRRAVAHVLHHLHPGGLSPGLDRGRFQLSGRTRNHVHPRGLHPVPGGLGHHRRRGRGHGIHPADPDHVRHARVPEDLGYMARWPT
jgi:small GTP-binding protein